MFALPIERYPDINMAVVNVTTDYPGASPTEVEALVTRKFEEAIDDIEDIEWISSSSQPERSYIRVKFVDDSDYDNLYDEVRLKILNAKEDIPPEADPPTIENVTMGVLLPVVIINLGGEHDNRALALMADQIKARLQKIDGVKKIVISGEFTREFHIYLDPEKLRAKGVSFGEVARVLREANVSVTAGHYNTPSDEFLIKMDERFHDRETLIKTIIRRDGDSGFIRLEDLITRADFDYRKPNIITTVNGKNAVALYVIKTPEGNALDIKDRVNDILDEFRPLIEREKLEVTLTQDSSVKINDGLSTLGWNLAVGMVLVAVITWYFVGIRNAGLVTIGIPFSFLITILVMYLTGYSFNEITLFAFVLVSGIIVDDAIVVTENIHRYIQNGRPVYHAIVAGTSEVALPVISSTLTTIAAFLPMLIMTGTTGEFFAQIPVAVSYALLASLFECLFILPIHYIHFGPQNDKYLSQRLDRDGLLISFFRRLIEKVLVWTLKYRFSTLAIVLLLFLASMGIMYVSIAGVLPLVKTKFFPDDYAVYFVDIKGPPNTSIDEMDRIAREISIAVLNEGPGKVDSTSGLAGVFMNEDYELIFGNNYGVVLVTLPEKRKQTIKDPMNYLESIRRELKEKFEKNGMVVNVHPMKEGPPSGKAINVKILGSNMRSVEQLTDNILGYLKKRDDIAPYLVELEHDQGIPKRVYRFDLRYERIKEYNLDSGEVARVAGSVLDGRYIGKFRSSDEEIDLKLLIEPDAITDPTYALSIPVVENAVGPILLGDLTRLSSGVEPGEFHRYQGQRAISIKADLKVGAPVSAPYITNEIGKHYNTIRNQYPGASLLFSGEFENTQRSYQSLIFAFFIAVLIIYLVLATQFQSYLQPVIILFSIIFAIIGIVLGKFITQSLFTVNSLIAVIGVIGVVVNDALVFIDFLNKGFRSGMSRHQAINEAVRVRLRPIILTTLTTILGLMPMAIGIPSYSIVWGTMASTFVTGLGVATLLTLSVVPVLWDLIEERKGR